jgi:hypothetical protein
MTMTDTFDELDALLDSAATTDTPPTGALLEVFSENCRACNGSGNFISWSGRNLGPCFKCKGKGKRAYRTSSAQRAQAKASASARKARKAVEAAEAFAAQQPVVAAWIAANPGFAFAVAMGEAVKKYGSLTERQLEAATKCATSQAQRAEAQAERATTAPTVDLDRVAQAFASAKSNGIKFPKLRLDTFTLTVAGPTSKTPGAIFVKEGETYLGKIAGGRFFGVSDCTQEIEARIVAAVADPAAAAVAYGKRTGSCACCGRELTNQVSIDLGIGPICLSRFGW